MPFSNASTSVNHIPDPEEARGPAESHIFALRKGRRKERHFEDTTQPAKIRAEARNWMNSIYHASVHTKRFLLTLA